MYTNHKLVMTYSLFALIATLANIGAQELVVRNYENSLKIIVSVIVGTGVGLIIKYLLDKNFIFMYETRCVLHDWWTFVMYSSMGLATTFVFWGFEFGFNYMFDSKEMRYFGGLIGLSIGYFIKYQLDKHFVFLKDRA